MNSKKLLAVYDEQKLFSEFLRNNLERIHEYDVLFITENEDKLTQYLTADVRLLLMHIPSASERLLSLANKVLRKFINTRILIYTQDVYPIQEYFSGSSGRLIVISTFNGSRDLFEGIRQLIPDHQNHRDYLNEKKKYNQSGFEKIRNNLKWISILKCYENGMRAKEMEEVLKLKGDTIHSYTEQMLKETQCGNVTALILEAKKKSII